MGWSKGDLGVRCFCAWKNWVSKDDLRLVGAMLKYKLNDDGGIFNYLLFSVADPDPGSGAFLTSGSGIRNRFFPDPGSRISDPGSQDHIFKSFLTIFLVKSSIIL